MRWCRQLLLDDTLRAFFCSSAATVVLALQETKLTAKTLNSALQLARFLFPRYRPYFNNCMEKNGYSGTAVLVRIDVPHGLPREIRSGEGRTMMVELHVSGSSVAGSVDGSMKVSLINIYSMNVGKDLKRLEEALSWRSDIYALIEKVACDENVLLLGDLNALLSKTPKHCHVKFADQELPSTTQVECDHLIRTFPGNLVIQDPVHMTMLHSVKGFVLDYVAVTRNLTWKAQTLPRGVLYSCNATRDHLPLWGSLMKKDN
jgi:exonuclease III